MSKLMRRAPAAETSVATESARSGKKARTREALELVAMRGRDVVGVRHLLPGGSTSIGETADAIARVPMKEFGGHALIIGRVSDKGVTVSVPARAKARIHPREGLCRIVAGPHDITLSRGERAVVVVGAVQIRAQIVEVEMFASGVATRQGAAGWIAFVAAVYVAALAICAALTPPRAGQLERGAMRRLHVDAAAQVSGL